MNRNESIAEGCLQTVILLLLMLAVFIGIYAAYLWCPICH